MEKQKIRPMKDGLLVKRLTEEEKLCSIQAKVVPAAMQAGLKGGSFKTDQFSNGGVRFSYGSLNANTNKYPVLFGTYPLGIINTAPVKNRLKRAISPISQPESLLSLEDALVVTADELVTVNSMAACRITVRVSG